MPREADVLEERATPSKEEKKRAPHTRVRRGGRVNQKLRTLANMYRDGHPGRDVRFVYDPAHKPDLSNVTDRHLDGYRMVYVKDLGDSIAEMLPGMKPEDPVRVGDTIMMSIEEEVRQEIQEDLNRAAAEDLGRVEEEYNQAIEEVELASGMRDEYRTKPRGRSVTELVEREVDVPESHKEA